MLVVLFQIVELVHRALMKGVVISKRCAASESWRLFFFEEQVSLYCPVRCCGDRNIYYQNPMLFGSQRVVDRYVDVLACSLGVQRAALNVVSGSVFSLSVRWIV